MFFNRIVAGLFALLVAAPCIAASMAERSPFTQGHWWNPARSGSGFEIFNAAGQVAVVWYTFDTNARPIWYTAQGDQDTLGTQAWALMQHRWSNGAISSSTAVGSLRLNVNHAQSMDAIWEIRGQRGTWAIEPLVFSGVVNEVDHSGSWYAPANGGWGLTVAEQGDVLGGSIFSYDSAGEPTWLAGYRRSTSSVEYFACSGACPHCAYQPTTTRGAGHLTFEFAAEAQLTVRNNLLVPMASGVNIDGARMVPLSRPASWRAADRQLASFATEAVLKAYLDAGMQNVTVSGLGVGVDFSPAPAGVAFSSTNLQEAGVDEADLVKSDGRLIYTYPADVYSGRRLPAVRVAQVGDEGGSLAIRGTVGLASGPSTPMDSAGLFLHRDKLISIAGTKATSYGRWGWGYPGSWLQGVTHIEVLATSESSVPVARWRAEIEGHVVSSRRIDDRLYVVSRFVPYLPGFAYGGTAYPPALASNQQILSSTPLASLLPKVRINGGEAVVAVPLSAFHLPPQGSRQPVADMVIVTAIDLVEPRIVQTLAIVGTTESVYASTTSLFLASSRQQLRNNLGALLPVEPPFYVTDIHQISLGTQAMAIVGSASIEGFLGADPDKSAFRMSEYQGRLRAVTSTTSSMWGGVNQNRLTILEPSMAAPGLLKTISYLPNSQRPQPLGKPNELLYATRFLGDRLYAVTFKNIDPLYVVDLANAADPRIAGELEVPGFSEYLHPLANGLLLGFGKDALPADTMGDAQFAWYQGLQLTLFDIVNASRPRELQRVLLGKRGSDSALLRQHHAFSSLVHSEASSSIAFPARIHDGIRQGAEPWSTYPWQESGLMRFELRGTTAADARLVQLPSLITHRAQQNIPSWRDSASDGARSVLFRNGSIYIVNGQFWRMDNAGSVSGPL